MSYFTLCGHGQLPGQCRVTGCAYSMQAEINWLPQMDEQMKETDRVSEVWASITHMTYEEMIRFCESLSNALEEVEDHPASWNIWEAASAVNRYAQEYFEEESSPDINLVDNGTDVDLGNDDGLG